MSKNFLSIFKYLVCNKYNNWINHTFYNLNLVFQTQMQNEKKKKNCVLDSIIVKWESNIHYYYFLYITQDQSQSKISPWIEYTFWIEYTLLLIIEIWDFSRRCIVTSRVKCCFRCRSYLFATFVVVLLLFVSYHLSHILYNFIFIKQKVSTCLLYSL